MIITSNTIEKEEEAATVLLFCTRTTLDSDCKASSVCSGCRNPPRRFMKNREIKDGSFVGNRVVSYLLTAARAGAKADINLLWDLANQDFFTKDEMREFYQLIGYSEGGYGEIFDQYEE